MRITYTLIFFLIQVSYAQQPEPTPSPFMEDIVKLFPNVRDLALTDQHDEAVFTAQSVMGDISVLATCRFDGTIWKEPQVMIFSGMYSDMEPFFSTDGLTLYFVSNRPLDDTSKQPKDYDIWYVSRINRNAQWSQPQNLGSPINTGKDEFYPVITDSKTIYFTLDDTDLGQKDDIYKSVFKDGKYQKPERLGPEINSEGYEFNAFVSSDESYLIYTCYNRDDGLGSGDLYISYNKEGVWQRSKPMGSVFNSDKMDYCPFVDEQTGLLYFTSKRLFPEKEPYNIDDLETLTTKLNSSYNGSSRLYQIPLHFINKLKD